MRIVPCPWRGRAARAVRPAGESELEVSIGRIALVVVLALVGVFGISVALHHPVVWWRRAGAGRVFYSAIGHMAQSYREPVYRQMLAGALDWALRRDGAGYDGASLAGASR